MEHSLPVQDPASRPTCYWEEIEKRSLEIDWRQGRYSWDEMEALACQLESLIQNAPYTQVWKRSVTRNTRIEPRHVVAWILKGKPRIIGLKIGERLIA